MAKRGSSSLSTEFSDGDESQPQKRSSKTDGDTTGSHSRRKHKPSKKQRQLDEDQHQKQQDELERLRKENAKLRKKAATTPSKSTGMSTAALQLDGSGFEPESEDDLDVINLQSAEQSKFKVSILALTFQSESPPGHNGLDQVAADTQSLQQPETGEVTMGPSSTLQSRTLQTAEWRDGKVPTGRPKAADYTPDVAGLLLRAINEFEWRIYTKNPFPDTEQQVQWAHEAWHAVIQARRDAGGYQLTDRMIGIIKTRKSNARNNVVTVVRAGVKTTYGFQDTQDKKSVQARENVKLYLKLMDDCTFLYKDDGTRSGERSGYAEHKIIWKMIHECFFHNADEIGVQFHKHFDPIPEVTHALIIAAISHCIEEWSTGIQIPVHFRESTTKAPYLGYLNALKKWEKGIEPVVFNIRKKWYQRVYKLSGAVSDSSSVPITISDAALEQANEKLRTRSGDTDSEGED
ncbi:hypothetical protein B0H21DRAFT_818182 [Amylocystis lapponica]|nr:hypothetical protein B0H21DRAFT_818182 [Amylocystis lapponica]